MSKYGSREKNRRQRQLVSDLHEHARYKFVRRMKFNFSLLDTSQEGAQSFASIKEEQRLKLINKIVELSRESRRHWETTRYGKQSLLSAYRDGFPDNSNFTRPSHIPDDVVWCRFRIEGDFRLVGFFISDGMHGEAYDESDVRYDKNTFYAVFIDPEHNFYPAP